MSTPPIKPVGVRWTPSNDSGQPYRPAMTHSFNAQSGERFVAWLVIVMLFAVAGLSLFDLYLLLSALG
jgi:hypothetical protein